MKALTRVLTGTALATGLFSLFVPATPAVADSPEQRRQALIAHGVPAEIADALDKQVHERLKGGIESEVDLSTHRLFNIKPTTFLDFAQRNAEVFGPALVTA